MARAAGGHRVFFIEEPVRRGNATYFEKHRVDGVNVVVPILSERVAAADVDRELSKALRQFMAGERINQPLLWYYTPLALPWTTDVDAKGVVYDCMDELRNFKFADPRLCELEDELIRQADVVFAGGRSLYEQKRHRHPRTHLFPSSVDGAHFRRARAELQQPADQASLPGPRIGYYGVIDERIDLELLDAVAHARPDWTLVMVGPLAKVTQEELPKRSNIAWLGLKSYDELPAYLAGWDVAMMPFALNDSTRFISPTKTPEYLSGGRPVVSTPITDVVHPYADEGLVHIAQSPEAFVAAIETAMATDRAELIARADRFLASQSWDATWSEMERVVNEVTAPRPADRRTAAQRPLRPVMTPTTAGAAVAAVPVTTGRTAPQASRLR